MSPLPSENVQAMLHQFDQFYSKQEYMKISEATNTHQFYSNQEVMKIYEARDNPYDQISDKKQRIFIDCFSNKLKVFK